MGIGWFGYSELTKSEISGSIIPTNKPVVIFDFDGTICDSFYQFIQAFVQSIAVTWGFHSKKLLESSSPKAIVDKPSDLIAIVSQ